MTNTMCKYKKFNLCLSSVMIIVTQLVGNA